MALEIVGMETTRRTVRWAPLVFAPLFCACTGYMVTPAAPLAEPPPAGAAKVCIVRAGSDGALSTFPLRDNSVLVGATVGGSCFCYFAGEGRHELEARSDGYDTLTVDVKAGAELFIVQATRAAVGIVRSRLEEVSSEEGKTAMSTCQYSVLTQVPEGTYTAKPRMVVVAR